jgi:hypothetical protein
LAGEVTERPDLAVISMAAFPSPLDDAALQAILTEHAVGSTRCYWSIHSADEALTFQYLGLELRAHLGEVRSR